MNERKLLEFRDLIARKDVEGIRNFYQHLHTENLELQDRNEFYYQFLMQFLNLEEYTDSRNKKEEPNSEHNYVCIRTKFSEDFYIDIFFRKKDLKLESYWYNAILFYNNMIGAETYLHLCEFNKPSLDSVKLCNNIVITVEQKETIPFYLEDWVEDYKDIFEKYDIFPRNVLSNGKELIFVFDLMRSINLQVTSVKIFYETIERKLNQLFNTEKKEWIHLPGSICSEKKLLIKKQPQFNEFQNRIYSDNCIQHLETGFQRCSYQGIPFYSGNAMNLSSLGNLFEEQSKNKTKAVFSENKKRYTNVGLQRLQDLKTLLKIRNYDLLEKRDYFEILANVMFYLELDFIEVLNEVNARNKEFLHPVKEEYLYSIVSFQYEKYLEYKTDSSKGIKYTNETIVKKLHITFEEQDEMLQLIEKNTVKLRKNYRDREYSKKHYKKKEKIVQDEDDNKLIQIQNMLQLGYSKAEISKQLHVSRNTISKLVKK